MKFKSSGASVCLVVLAIVFLYCVHGGVHGGVAGQHREDCVKKEEPEPHKIFVTITITGLRKVLSFASEASALKQLGYITII